MLLGAVSLRKVVHRFCIAHRLGCKGKIAKLIAPFCYRMHT